MPIHCRRAFIIGLDGAMGSAMRRADTPHLDRLLAEGVVTYTARSVYPSYSYQAWGAMFHGVGPEKHAIDEDHPCADDTPWPSFMKAAREARPEFSCAAFSCWEPINTRLLEAGLDCHRVSLPDPELAEAAADYIRHSPPHLFFMHLDFIDGAGHAHTYGSDAYLAQITATDAHVGQVFDAIRAAGCWDESLVMVLSDHGGVDTDHGGKEPGCMEIIWSCRGPGINQGIELATEVGIADTAPVVMRALGLNAPVGWESSIPPGVFGT